MSNVRYITSIRLAGRRQADVRGIANVRPAPAALDPDIVGLILASLSTKGQRP